jgi:hypothetical protein
MHNTYFKRSCNTVIQSNQPKKVEILTNDQVNALPGTGSGTKRLHYLKSGMSRERLIPPEHRRIIACISFPFGLQNPFVATYINAAATLLGEGGEGHHQDGLLEWVEWVEWVEGC